MLRASRSPICCTSGGLNTTFSEPFVFSVGKEGILNEYTTDEIEKMYPEVSDPNDLREFEPINRVSLNPMHGDKNNTSGRFTNEGLIGMMATNNTDLGEEKKVNSSNASVMQCFYCCYSYRHKKSPILASYSREIKSDKFAGIHNDEKTENTEITEENIVPQVIYVEGTVH